MLMYILSTIRFYRRKTNRAILKITSGTISTTTTTPVTTTTTTTATAGGRETIILLKK